MSHQSVPNNSIHHSTNLHLPSNILPHSQYHVHQNSTYYNSSFPNYIGAGGNHQAFPTEDQNSSISVISVPQQRHFHVGNYGEGISSYHLSNNSLNNISCNQNSVVNDKATKRLSPKKYSEKKKSSPFKFIECKCRLQCHELTRDKRLRLHRKYLKLSSWDLQSVFISSCVALEDVKDHRKTPEHLQRKRSVKYYLGRYQVCKNVFAGTLGITFSRITYLVTNKIDIENCLILPDKRGRKEPANKVSECVRKQIAQFLDKFPKYKSRCSSSNNKIYFPPHLNKKQVFDMYKESHPESKISNFVFRDELKKINIFFYDPKKEHCSKCDLIHTNKNDRSPSKCVQLAPNEPPIRHKYNLTAAKEMLCRAEKEAKTKDDLLCFSFDMQKVQEIPFLTSSVNHCKRHMWLYNFGINTFHNNQAHMFTWTEVEGKRGSCEVASCINQFLSQIDLSRYRRIHSFSDSRNDQNRNEIIMCFMMFICQTTPIHSWRHSYVETAHNVLPNENDFIKIEKTKKIQKGIFNHEQWMSIYRMCKFKVTHMEGKFLNFTHLLSPNFFLNAAVTTAKLDWSDLKDYMVIAELGIIQYYSSRSPDAQMQQIDFGIMHSSRLLPILYQERLKLSKKKYDDIVSVLNEVPSPYAEQLRMLPHEMQDYEGICEPHPDIDD